MVKIEGNAGVETAALLKQELVRAHIAHDVAIDWAEAEHVETCVLQVLLALRKWLLDRGLSLVVEKDNSKVRGYLTVSGLSEYFPVRDHLPEVPSSEGSNA